MPAKRTGDDPRRTRPMKQSKLDFGPSLRPKSTKVDEQEEEQQEQQSPNDDSAEHVRDHGPQKRHTSNDTAPPDNTSDAGAADQPPQNTKSSGDDGSEQRPDAPADSSPRVKVTVVDKVGDIFDAPPNTVIIHACNCIGHWGAGIAAAFKSRYPEAYERHAAYCKGRRPVELVGTAQLIAPCEVPGKDSEPAPSHYIGCLFTSKRYGRNRDKPQQIIAATGPAMKDLLSQVKMMVRDGKPISEIRTCQINAGMFAVPWEKSKDAMQSVEVKGLDEALTTVVAFVRG